MMCTSCTAYISALLASPTCGPGPGMGLHEISDRSLTQKENSPSKDSVPFRVCSVTRPPARHKFQRIHTLTIVYSDFRPALCTPIISVSWTAVTKYQHPSYRPAHPTYQKGATYVSLFVRRGPEPLDKRKQKKNRSTTQYHTNSCFDFLFTRDSQDKNLFYPGRNHPQQ